MDQIWNRIEEVAKADTCFIQTAQVAELGISRPMLKKYSDAGKLERIRKGLFVLAGEFLDEYALLQIRSKFAVFSYGTALFLWGLSVRVPHVYDITLPSGENINSLKMLCPIFAAIMCSRKSMRSEQHRCNPPGATVKIYDRERCICDLIRDKDPMDMQLYRKSGYSKKYLGEHEAEILLRKAAKKAFENWGL